MRRAVWVVAFLAGCSVALEAQVVSVYVTSASTRFSNAQAVGQGQTTPFWTSGVGGGMTLNMIPVGPVRFGIDLRGSTRPGTLGSDTGMAGIRLGLNPPLMKIKPYVQASGGYVATRTRAMSGGTFRNQYAGWEVLGGIDYPLVPFFDVRVIEVGGGSAYPLQASASAPNLSLLTINAGLVFHF
jgi:hypothetical protein